MDLQFSKEKNLQSSLSPYDSYCVGYPHQGGYLAALVMNVDSFKETFSHIGSKVLDGIVAYDRAEINTAYLGQINMMNVSSFCGPCGLIWGYDIAKEENLALPSYLPKELLQEKFPEILIKNGENLRKAAIFLIGTKEKKHFPILPGSHVPCAGRWQFASGPTYLYAAIAIGIPENRNKYACLLMEDVGQVMNTDDLTDFVKQKISLNVIQSVIEISKNQSINYKEIFIDFVARKIEPEEIGCALIAMPYLHLAKNAYGENLPNQTLNDWFNEKKPFFLDTI